MFLVDHLKEPERTIAGLVKNLRSLFENKANSATLCTIHKSKGLENDRVFWLNRSKCPSAMARQDWEREQEKNLCYVATTRAKQSLIIIELE